MSLAEQLVGDLMLVSVLVAGDGAQALSAELGAAGAAAEAWVPGQAWEGFDLAILLADASASGSAEVRTMVGALAQASDRVLFAPLPLGPARGDAPGLPELPAWFELFAELGYQPVVEFDASFVSAGAFLVDRAATADEGDLAAFTDRLQMGPDAARVQREAVADAERNVRSELLTARDTVAAREAELAGMRATLQEARAELASVTGRAAELAEALQQAERASQERAQQNEGWEGLRSWVRVLVGGAGRDNAAALGRDLARLNALRAPDLPPVVLPAARGWFRRRRADDGVLAAAALVRACPLFDAAWYVAANPETSEGQALDPVFHYVLVGGPRLRDPGPWFDAQAYAQAHPEGAALPLVHAIRSGALERGSPVAV